MADEDVSKPAEPPKPVHIGGESIADRILPHIKKIVVGVIVLAVVLSAFFGYRAYKHSKQEEETAKLAKVLAVAQRPLEDPSIPKNAGIETFKDGKTRALAVLDEMAKQGTSGPTPTFRAGFLLEAGKIDEAITEYRKAQNAKGIDGVLAREGLGIALETKALATPDKAAQDKLLAEALAAFTQMQPDAAGPRHAYALYHQGRVQEQLKKPAEAKALYEKAKSLDNGGELTVLVDRRISSLGGA